MIEAQVPEFADGGYWYVIPAVEVTGDEAPGWTFGGFRDVVGFYAEVDGQQIAVLRSPRAMTGLTKATAATINAVLSSAGYSSKPHARSGGL